MKPMKTGLSSSKGILSSSKDILSQPMIPT